MAVFRRYDLASRKCFSDGSTFGAATHALTRSADVLMGEAMGLNAALDCLEELRILQVVIEFS
ncbi:hypothetical protein L195_g022003 [Trifolium pratense]|uniref:Uncharacterized protein n=1 Tax=Trifolium pratense TaxID=57577 RepID=A0A2K3N6U3_TRIPR|nr:hypothetical protein L195_g022003 [Trifolium pratense]